MSKPIDLHGIAEALCIKAEKLGLDNPTESMISDCLLNVVCNVLDAPVETALSIPGNQDSTTMVMHRRNKELFDALLELSQATQTNACDCHDEPEGDSCGYCMRRSAAHIGARNVLAKMKQSPIRYPEIK